MDLFRRLFARLDVKHFDIHVKMILPNAAEKYYVKPICNIRSYTCRASLFLKKIPWNKFSTDKSHRGLDKRLKLKPDDQTINFLYFYYICKRLKPWKYAEYVLWICKFFTEKCYVLHALRYQIKTGCQIRHGVWQKNWFIT